MHRQEALEQARQAVRAEMERTRAQLRRELQQALAGSTLLGLGAWLGLGGMLALAAALGLTLHRPGRTVLLAGLGFTGGAVLAGLAGLRTLPRRPRPPVRRGLRSLPV